MARDYVASENLARLVLDNAPFVDKEHIEIFETSLARYEFEHDGKSPKINSVRMMREKIGEAVMGCICISAYRAVDQRKRTVTIAKEGRFVDEFVNIFLRDYGFIGLRNMTEILARVYDEFRSHLQRTSPVEMAYGKLDFVDNAIILKDIPPNFGKFTSLDEIPLEKWLVTE